MIMAAGPMLTPGSLVVWFDRDDVPNYALVVQFEEHLANQCYVATILKEQRIRTLNLFHCERGTRWRVLCRS